MPEYNGYACIYFRFFVFLLGAFGDFDGVLCVGGDVAGVSFTFEVASVLPFNGFAVVGTFGSGPDGNAAKDENTAWGVGTWASTALDLPYFNSFSARNPELCSNRLRIFSFAIISLAV